MTQLTKKIKEIFIAIKLNKLRIDYLKAVIDKKSFSYYVLGDYKRKLPEVIEEGRKLKEEYKKLTGKRYYPSP